MYKKICDFGDFQSCENCSVFSCKANTAAVSDLGIQRESLIMGKFENVKMLVVGRKMMSPQESRLAQL